MGLFRWFSVAVTLFLSLYLGEKSEEISALYLTRSFKVPFILPVTCFVECVHLGFKFMFACGFVHGSFTFNWPLVYLHVWLLPYNSSIYLHMGFLDRIHSSPYMILTREELTCICESFFAMSASFTCILILCGSYTWFSCFRKRSS